MQRATALLALAAALAGTVLGVGDTLRGSPGEAVAPRWAPTLAPLAAAPLGAHEVVVLALPRSVSPEQARPLLFEAAFQRPGVRWTLAGATAVADAVVTLATAPAPPGWDRVWHEGDVAVWRRPKP